MTEATQQAGPPADPRLQLLLAGLTAVRGGDFSTRLPHRGDPPHRVCLICHHWLTCNPACRRIHVNGR